MYINAKNLIIKRPRPLIYINDRQTDFNRKHEAYNRAIKKYETRIELVCRLLDVKEGMKILEVGGGVGFDLYELANLGAICTDVDICPGNAEFVNACSKFYRLQIKSLQGDSCELPFKDENFDAVFSISTFEHIWDCDRALHEQVRVLKKGGRIVIIDGNLLNPKNFYNLFVRRFLKPRGNEAGLKWLLSKSRPLDNFGIGWRGKDEDIKTVFWWKKKMKSLNELDVIDITTTRAYNNPNNIVYKLFKPFVGGIIALAVKS